MWINKTAASATKRPPPNQPTTYFQPICQPISRNHETRASCDNQPVAAPTLVNLAATMPSSKNKSPYGYS
jgi:hypothetical protein